MGLPRALFLLALCTAALCACRPPVTPPPAPITIDAAHSSAFYWGRIPGGTLAVKLSNAWLHPTAAAVPGQQVVYYLDRPFDSKPTPYTVTVQVLDAAQQIIYAPEPLTGVNITRPPNIVFLLLDTLRADEVDASRGGVPVMPNLARYAATGANFTQATSPGPWTAPGIIGMFTGMHADGQWRDEPNSDSRKEQTHFYIEGQQILPQWLHDLGYDTWAQFTNGNIIKEYGFDKGFNSHRYDAFTPAVNVTDNTLAQLKEMKEPFFVYSHYIDPHSPYVPIDQYRDIFGPFPAPLTTGDNAILSLTSVQTFQQFTLAKLLAFVAGEPLPTGTPTLTDNGREGLHYRYDSKCKYLDDDIAAEGGLIPTIQHDYPNTIFVVVSDHGEDFLERAHVGFGEQEYEVFGHGHSVYQELLHVPFMLFGPGIPAGVVERPVSTLGLLPTIATLLHQPAQPQWQGHNVLDPTDVGPSFAFTRIKFGNVVVTATSVRDGNLKYIDLATYGGPQLYDLAADPEERNNLAAAQPAEAARLKALVDAYKANLTQSIDPNSPPPG